MSTHFNGLTPAELERLACLAEELSEAGQIINKIVRHGFESHHPTNRDSLHRELGDVLFWARELCAVGDLEAARLNHRMEEKAASVGQYLHHHKLGRRS